MREIFYIDELKKLTVKKDSSLLMALTAKEQGKDVYLLFENDLFYNNTTKNELTLYRFTGSFVKNQFYIEEFSITESEQIELLAGDRIHMRLDPPFDSTYLRNLWILKMFQRDGILISNNPGGILLFNEKLTAYQLPNSIKTYIGTSEDGFLSFSKSLNINEKVVDSLILKPMDFFQGIGVEKLSLNISDLELKKAFSKKVQEYKGPIIVQPYLKEVEKGEIRAVFFQGKEIGSIIKVPPKGKFLANIAQGATFEPITLETQLLHECETLCRELLVTGVEHVSIDILAGKISEVNITCRGLLVEVSHAHKRNLALSMFN